jgi:hypothetical protein
MGGGYGTLETSGESFSEVPPARTTTWKSISSCSCGGNGGDRRRGFWCSPDSPGGNSQWEFQQSLDRAGCSGPSWAGSWDTPRKQSFRSIGFDPIWTNQPKLRCSHVKSVNGISRWWRPERAGRAH